MFKILFTDVAISMTCRSLVLFEGRAEVEPFIAVWATVVVKGVTVVFEALNGSEKAVAAMAETVSCIALVVFQSV